MAGDHDVAARQLVKVAGTGAWPGSGQGTSLEGGASNGRVPGAKHMLDFTDSLGTRYRIVSHDLTSEEMIWARDEMLEFMEGKLEEFMANMGFEDD